MSKWLGWWWQQQSPQEPEPEPEFELVEFEAEKLLNLLPSLVRYTRAYIERKQLESLTAADYLILFAQLVAFFSVLLIVYHSFSAIKSVIAWIYRSISSVIVMAFKFSAVLVVIYALLVNRWWAAIGSSV